MFDRRFIGFYLTAALCLFCPWQSSGAEENNDDLNVQVAALIGSHNFALPLSFLPDPLVGVPAQAVTFGTNLGLKYVKAPFLEPSDKTFTPTTGNSSQGDRCDYSFALPQSSWRYANFLGLRESSPLPLDWGALGQPQVAHANTEVIVKARNRYIEDLGTPQAGLFVNDDTPRNQQVRLPAGRHIIDWQATTQLDEVMDIIIPGVFLGYNIGKYGAAFADGGISGARLLAQNQTWKETMIQWGIKGGFLTADQFGLFQTSPTVTHSREQIITVHDVLPPVLAIEPGTLTLEASDFGGALLSRVNDRLRKRVTAYDECGRPHTLSNDAPVLLPIGETDINWTVTDFGPNVQGLRNSVSGMQRVVVQDTQAPIIVAPASRVVEVPANEPGITATSLQLGMPMVVDLADVSPSISSDSPSFFPINSRANIIWSATDDSGNTGSSTQFVTVKAEGTNTTPVAIDASASTLTSRPVDLILRGSDADFLDGQFDPISFSILDRPMNGEFVAPLFPFFIEDYRTNPDGPYGEPFRLSDNRSSWMYDNVCRQNQTPRKDFVFSPLFTHVTDDGTYFIIDFGWRCNASDATTDKRISKWDRDGNYLGEMSYNGTNDTFTMVGDFIYTLDRTGSGSSSRLGMFRCRSDFDTAGSDCDFLFQFRSSSAPNLSAGQLSYALLDQERELIYVNDRSRVYVFDARDETALDPQFLGSLNNGARVIGALNNSCSFFSSWTGFTMTLDSEGALYVLDSCTDRIHKFSPSQFSNNVFTAGDYIGWMGRCDASTNKACDLERNASKGYSCTDATCTMNSFQTSGDALGQFSDPEHMVMDPNDVLYVADRGNLRIQRFAPDGTFAGEAASTGTGVNQGERPGFVLGNFGTPRAVSVNSTQFFVTDREESFVHVFQTSPFKDITNDSATVTYVSEFSFHSGTDSFTFQATDGLDTSPPATATIRVDRNFRPPVAFASSVELSEDTTATVSFSGDDPDGIAGEDFNGLDSLTYRVIQQPRSGRVTGSGDQRTYTPFVDFSGEDFFLYVANDGVHDSEPARVDVLVSPVDDAPKALSLELPQNPGLGFEVALRGTFIDDGSQSYGTSVNWGDGSLIEGRGDFVEDEANGEARLEGVKIIEPVENIANGQAIASHTYLMPGNKTIQWCIWDEDGDATCLNKSVTVEPTVYLDLQVTAGTNTAAMNSLVTLSIKVTNTEPRGVPGMAARNVILVQDSNSQLMAQSLPGAPAGCSINNELLSCSFGDLTVGESVSFDLIVSYSGVRFYSELATAAFEASSDTASVLVSSLAQPAVSFMADAVDSDGDGMTDIWEIEYGFNPNLNDAGADFDSDGLTNGQEFVLRTIPTNADSDNDGFRDGEEVGLGMNPTVTADTDRDGRANDIDSDDDNDGISDVVERGLALNPLDASDALKDKDGDGFSNRAEVEAGSDPDDASDVPAMTGDSPTLFSSILPLNRSGTIGQTVGAFATLINAGTATARNCSMVPLRPLAADFTFAPTDPATNAVNGEVNQGMDVLAGGAQTFVFNFTANAEIDAEVEFRFGCSNTEPAPSFSGLNTFRLQAAVDATPDIVALAATVSNDGIVQLSQGLGAFSVATVNVGAGDWVTARPVVAPGLQASAFVCETDPVTASCINPVLPSTEALVLVGEQTTPTFSVFVNAADGIALDPVNSRIKLEFVDSAGKVRGSSSVAVQYVR